VLRRPGRIYAREVAEQSTVIAAAAYVARTYDFERHPYFVWMRDPETTLAEFRDTQIPYKHYVENFSRSLGAVLARVSAMRERLSTVFENVLEEHGHGQLHKTHEATFAGYLRAIGVPESRVETPCPTNIAYAYESLLDFCLAHSAEEGAAAIGIVEYTHIHIAGMIRRTVHDRFWGDVDAQYHYSLHEKLDIQHAQDLFKVCDPHWTDRPARERIAYAMLIGVHSWWTLFESMLPLAELRMAPQDAVSTMMAGAAPDEPVPEDAPHLRRRFQRVPCDLAVSAELHGRRHDLRAISISIGGLYLMPGPPAELDAPIEMQISFPSRSEPLAIRGRIRVVGRPDAGIGIEFEALGETMRDVLAREIATLR
jgi:pyrroloquinoline quinone (PQQ) biosynthesis protein C